MEAKIVLGREELVALAEKHIQGQFPAPEGHKWLGMERYGRIEVELVPKEEGSEKPAPEGEE